MNMNVTVNNKQVELAEPVTVKALLIQCNHNPETVLVSVNDEVLQQDDYDQVLLKENDRLDLMTFVGGG